MAAKSIKKISDAELTEAAFAYARNIAGILNKRGNSQVLLDSVEKAFQVQIVFMNSGNSNLRGVEKRIVEAYTSAGTDPGDNIQKMGNDSLLYSKPLMKERPDGSLEFNQAVGIRMTKKTVVLSIKE
ncbi:hypothetical protein WSM22_15520 [Cytophagales bacterium WSM2-2]|nr:hypothetical protein WSM22_15520 [Cytophagales bacterium WSM2-2]